MRIILFTGKGGVGKTTTAAATALHCAQQGLKTLVLSTDPAHSLADALNQTLGPEPTPIRPNLWGQEIDVYYSMKKHWDNMRQLMLSIFKWKGVKNVVAEELSVLPGMEEATAFLWIEQYEREKQFDVLIIDSAPTGETLTLLTLPQVTQSWLTKAFPGQQFAIKTLGSILRKTKGIPLDKGYEELQRLFAKLERVQSIMLNPQICSIRLVLNPERMVIQEAKRAYMYLQLYGYLVDAVVVNRVLPDSANKNGDFMQGYWQAQQNYLLEIQESFDPLPILKIQHRGREVFGLELLQTLSQELYPQDQFPQAAAFFHQSPPIQLEETESHYWLKLKLPFLQEKDFHLEKFGEELVITIGNRRTSLYLPRFANYLAMQGHQYHDGILTIKLVKG